jgi:hypothetical protein
MSTIKCNQFQIYMSIALEQRLLFHRREKITNKINEIQKRNHQRLLFVLFLFFLPSFVSPQEEQKFSSLKLSNIVHSPIFLIPSL